MGPENGLAFWGCFLSNHRWQYKKSLMMFITLSAVGMLCMACINFVMTHAVRVNSWPSRKARYVQL